MIQDGKKVHILFHKMVNDSYINKELGDKDNVTHVH